MSGPPSRGDESRVTLYRKRKRRADPTHSSSSSDSEILETDRVLPTNSEETQSSNHDDTEGNDPSDDEMEMEDELIQGDRDQEEEDNPANDPDIHHADEGVLPMLPRHPPTPGSSPPSSNSTDSEGSPIPRNNVEDEKEDESTSESDHGSLFPDDEDEPFEQQGLPGYDPPLYRNSPITLGQSMLLIMTFAMAHNLTGVALSDLLSLVALHCLAENNLCKKTLFKFKKYFASVDSPIKFHYYCSNCFSSLLSKDDVCENPDCNNDNEKEVCYFLEMSIIDQLRVMFKRSGFYQNLQLSKTRVKKNRANYEDIYDGQLYKDMIEDGFLSNPNNISFLYNSDSARIFKSAKFEIWPIYLAINELPYRMRFKRQNMIVAGLWFGKSKPPASIFLGAFHNEFANLFDGVNFQVFGNENPVTVRGRILCGTCDLPAKALFLNLIGHTGYYGCPACYTRGEKSERTENRLCFPYEVAPLRTDLDTTRYGQIAANVNDGNVFGIKGLSPLRLFIPNYLTSAAIDVMHCVWLGVSKKLLELWFDSTYTDQPFSLNRVSATVNEFIVAITPCFVQRVPRSIHLAFWKAHEFKLWLLYYSVPVLFSVMSEEYFNHHLMLVDAILLLNQDSISEGNVQEAEMCIREYVRKFQYLYGLKYLSLNVHLLVHLPDCVRKFGPLWTVSCMPFEDMNGKLARLVHGTRYAALQIMSSFSQFANLPILIAKLRGDDPIRLWCETLLDRRKKFKITERVIPGICVVGNYKPMRPVPLVIHEALVQSGVVVGKVKRFFKLKKGALVYCSSSYTRQLKTSSYAAKVDHNGVLKYGFIEIFVRVQQCDCPEVCQCDPRYYAIVSSLNCFHPFQIVYPAVTVRHIYQSVESGEYFAVKVECLKGICFNVQVADANYVIDTVNDLEDE